jgi:predicted nucleic acid-binding protein
MECDDIHEVAVEIALTTGCRAIGSFFMACARCTNPILLSNGGVQVESARKADIEAYHS